MLYKYTCLYMYLTKLAVLFMSKGNNNVTIKDMTT